MRCSCKKEKTGAPKKEIDLLHSLQSFYKYFTGYAARQMHCPTRLAALNFLRVAHSHATLGRAAARTRPTKYEYDLHRHTRAKLPPKEAHPQPQLQNFIHYSSL